MTAASRYPLTVIARRTGTRSETFIRRHMADLLPGQTAVIVRSPPEGGTGQWAVDAPTLILDQVSLKRVRRSWRERFVERRTVDQAYVVERFLREQGTEVVLGQYLDLSLAWLEAVHAAGAAYFVHGHGVDVSRRLREGTWREQYLRYNDVAGVIVVAEHSRQRLLALGLNPSLVHVVPCGVDVAAVPPEPVPEDGEVRCLAVGRMVAKKAPILLLDAFRRAAAMVPGLRLDYVGGGELLPAARQFVRALGLEERVRLHGPQPPETVAALTAAAHLFAQHSITDPDTGDEEGLPVAVLEAMAGGLPVVATRHAGIPEAVAEGETGYLVEEGDTVGMGERLAALARDPALRRRLGIAAWQRARHHFSWERERAELLRIMRLAGSAQGRCGQDERHQ